MNLLACIPTSQLQQELDRRSINPEPESTPSNVSQVALAVAEAFEVDNGLLLGRSRLAEVAVARFACWLILSDQGLSRTEMARAFGRADVGTIRHGVMRANHLVSRNKTFRHRVKLAIEKLTTSQPTPH